jgi:hypothetical protein
MKRWTYSLCAFGLVTMVAVIAGAGEPRPIAHPFDGADTVAIPSTAIEWPTQRISTDHLVLGADHILDQQCHNGGFGWPHDDCSATYHNITGPILLGVLGAYALTGDDGLLVGAVNGGAFDLTHQYPNGEARFATFTPAFMLELAGYSDNSTFSWFVATGLFDELVAGTYGPDDLDTAGWIADIEAGRSGAWINLRPWEFHTLIPAAQALGLPGQDALFEQGVLDGLATLDNTDSASVYSDLIGVAGGVRGLAFAARSDFPAISAPLHPGVNNIATLDGLTAYLAALQNADGSWYWHSNLAAPATDDKDVQTTAYALLALLEADAMTATSYVAATQAARDWIVSIQLPSGGFPQWPGGDENTEVEGEALTAVAAFDARIFVDGFESGDVGLWSDQAP